MADQIVFKPLPEVDTGELMGLMNHPLVRRHMPLLQGFFDETACANFIEAKQRLWKEHGYGPWAIYVDGSFAGWGGVAPENGEPDLGLVLHPRYWGWGKAIYEKVIQRAFGEMGFDSLTALLPPSRTRVRGVLRLGFKIDGEIKIGSQRFIRYRLKAKDSK